MIDATQNLLLIDGKNKTSQVEEISKDNAGWLYIRFHGSPKTYRYGKEKITWLTHPDKINIQHSQIFIHNHQVNHIKELSAFRHRQKVYWYVVYPNGCTQYLIDEELILKSSCLEDKKSSNVFEYLKEIASTNILGKEEGINSNGILSKLYSNINFINNKLAISPYLNPSNGIKHYKDSNFIFPFGCNASQKKAVIRAFENQISVIQGPPGTGKTQTILNIITNIIRKGKTVLVVSNNNSATTNVLDKLNKDGLGFIVAPLGKKENKEAFINNQPSLPDSLQDWECDQANKLQKEKGVDNALSKLDRIFTIQEKLALSKQELQGLKLEWEHFSQEQNIDYLSFNIPKAMTSLKIMKLWLQFQAYAEDEVITPAGWLQKLKESIKWWWMNFKGKHLLRLKSKFKKSNLSSIISELQTSYYQLKIIELNEQITNLQIELKTYDAKAESKKLSEVSMQLFKAVLFDKYSKKERKHFSSVRDLRANAQLMQEQYPVVLSTTFSSRICLSDGAEFDYLIMDEASQVSIETGALALTCAKNAIIVGDTLQLPNVVTNEDKKKLDSITTKYDIPSGYNCTNQSFLQSICEILPDAPQTLLREHYRCHPRIINFCNKKFYGGELLIMTEEDNKPDTMWAIKTSPGNHMRGHYNQREIDVIRDEVLTHLPNKTNVGIIAPYNAQVKELSKQLQNIESATVHKFQGREKDTIIMSVVDDQITEFSDDPNLLNVAISRAKERFCLVVSGNEQELSGDISELLSYIEYNNFTVSESKIHSIFDYLYSQYTQQRLAFIRKHTKISEYDSENLTFILIEKVLKEHSIFHSLGVLCHVPLRHIIKDTSLLNNEERNYTDNYSTHVDFLIINHVSKKPVLIVETDGYSFHHNETEQHQRDVKKDHILSLYQLPLLRLSTIGSNEEERLVNELQQSYSFTPSVLKP